MASDLGVLLVALANTPHATPSLRPSLPPSLRPSLPPLFASKRRVPRVPAFLIGLVVRGLQEEEEEVEGEEEEEAVAVEDLSNSDVTTKYQEAAKIANLALQGVVQQCVAGARINDLCKFGDTVIEQVLVLEHFWFLHKF